MRKALVFVFVTLTGCASFAAGETSAPDGGAPDASAPVDDASSATHVRRIFVTSEQFTGNLRNTSGADEKCTSIALRAGHTGDWTAWVGRSANLPLDRLAARADTVWIRPDDVVVARGVAALKSGQLEAPIQIDENKANVGDALVWTGVARDGTVSGPACVAWQSAEATEVGRTGRTGSVDRSWTDGPTQTCDMLGRLYCFER